MSCQLKAGDRVRVTVRNRMHGYQPGDKGEVLREITAGPSGACYYVVAMDKDGLRARSRTAPTLRPAASGRSTGRGHVLRRMACWYAVAGAVAGDHVWDGFFPSFFSCIPQIPRLPSSPIRLS